MIKGEVIKFPEKRKEVLTSGSAGLASQLPGVATTVSAIAAATGEIAGGGFIETNH